MYLRDYQKECINVMISNRKPRKAEQVTRRNGGLPSFAGREMIPLFAVVGRRQHIV